MIHEEHFSQQGVEIDLYVTRDANGIVLAEATLRDPKSRATQVDVWTDGVTVWWHGTIDGAQVRGSAAARDFSEGPQEAAFCFTPVTAIICLGALVVLVGTEGCAHTTWCTRDNPPEVPGGAGGVPEDGGDGDGDGDGSGSAGGDED